MSRRTRLPGPYRWVQPQMLIRAARSGAAGDVCRVSVPFQLEYLGFTLDWEHQFEPQQPPYAQVLRSEAVLHLSEHLGDGSQYGVVRIPVRNITSLREELPARPDAGSVPRSLPGAPGGPTMQVIWPTTSKASRRQVHSDPGGGR